LFYNWALNYWGISLPESLFPLLKPLSSEACINGHCFLCPTLSEFWGGWDHFTEQSFYSESSPVFLHLGNKTHHFMTITQGLVTTNSDCLASSTEERPPS
jgi:hypothetical protein